MSLRIVYMGTPAFAVEPLRALAGVHEVALVCTAPDAVRGRGKRLEPSPVKAAAEELGIAVRCPRKLSDEGTLEELTAIAPDAICVAAYGAILPRAVLELPRFGCFNIHGSLLPRWRGAAPIERAILAGDERCGCSIMRMEEGLDTGAYCIQRSLGIGEKSAREITAELSALGAEALLEALTMAEAGTILWSAQDGRDATYAEKLAKGELDGDPALSAIQNVRRVRASSDAHASRCIVDGRSATLLSARTLAPEAATLAEGIACGAVAWKASALLFGCADGAFEVLDIKPDGKRAMDAASFVAGHAAIRDATASWSALKR